MQRGVTIISVLFLFLLLIATGLIWFSVWADVTIDTSINIIDLTGLILTIALILATPVIIDRWSHRRNHITESVKEKVALVQGYLNTVAGVYRKATENQAVAQGEVQSVLWAFKDVNNVIYLLDEQLKEMGGGKLVKHTKELRDAIRTYKAHVTGAPFDSGNPPSALDLAKSDRFLLVVFQKLDHIRYLSA